MTIREKAEAREQLLYSPYAAFSRNSRGRDVYEEPCDIRTDYQRDRDRILHSKSFRRLKHKTQVFLKPEGDHYRTRLTHTLEVAQISRTIAKALRLNDDLADAIALGHDLGHTPFGHAGESALNEICPYGFTHVEQSLRVVEILEKDGKGLNLTWEVRDGILNHRTAGHPHTMEGKIVRMCDKIAYLNHDIDDAKRAGILEEDEIPNAYRDSLGFSTRERLNTMIHDIVYNSDGKDDIIMSEKIEQQMKELRSFMFEHVYRNPAAKTEEWKAKHMLKQLYQYYMEHLEMLPAEYQDLIHNRAERAERVVCDYIAGMTDQYSMQKYAKIFIPQSWNR